MKKILAFVLGCLMCGVPLQAATYTVAPVGYSTVLDASGNPVSNAKICTYVAGTSTPVTTYADSGGTANANPLRADSAGRYVMFLAPGSSYKFTFQDATGTVGVCDGALIKTVDNISAMGLGSVQANDVGSCEGRMTLTSGTPVTTSDVTAATTIYFTPYKGNVCSTYDPTAGTWTLTTFAEVSLALGADAASRPYDLFGYSNSGAFTLERLVWTSDTVRATSLTTQDGVLVKAGQTSRRYLGTYRTTAVIGQTENSVAKRYVWNYYNRVISDMRALESTNSWQYQTAAFRQANANVANQLDFVVGYPESIVSADVIATAESSQAAGGILMVASIGLDSTTVAVTGVRAYNGLNMVQNIQQQLSAKWNGFPGIGRHVLVWLEYSTAAGTTTWYGDNNVPTISQNGIAGTITN